MDIKTAKSADLEQINQFLTQNLRANVDWSLKDEYPLAFADNNLPNLKIIRDTDQILAHAVLKTNIIRTQYHLFKVGFIGSVVTAQEHRGKGYSSQLIEHCLEDSRKQNCDFTMLWTNLFNFYAKLGFETGGTEIALEVSKSFTPPAKDTLKILQTPRVSPDALLKLYNKHNLRSRRTSNDIAQCLKIPNSRIYTAWNKTTNLMEAYCILGKGADFTNYIHEWGGNVSSLLHLVKYIYDDNKTDITLITHPQCQNLIHSMEQHGAEKFFGILGMIHITNPESFCKKIKRGARALGYDSLIFDFKDGRYYFGYDDEIYKTDSSADIVRLVFGPLKPAEIHEFHPETLAILNEIFPIPFWVWGWDSI